MMFNQILLLLLPLSTLTLGAPAADPAVNDAANAQSSNLEKRNIIPYLPHVRCVVKDGHNGRVNVEQSWAVTAACCFGCSEQISGKNCEQFCDPRVGTCCQMGDPETSGFGECCRTSSSPTVYDPHVATCNPAPYWPPSRNNCKKKRSVFENAVFDYDEIEYDGDAA